MVAMRAPEAWGTMATRRAPVIQYDQDMMYDARFHYQEASHRLPTHRFLPTPSLFPSPYLCLIHFLICSVARMDPPSMEETSIMQEIRIIIRSLDDPNATLNACYDSEQRFPHPIAILALVHGSSRS
ncbi:hypothetical protein WG66_006430 [Moniliophthora roreri]|nr:hypothetical protein WG66_006430 [Moniliophthora roreri]